MKKSQLSTKNHPQTQQTQKDDCQDWSFQSEQTTYDATEDNNHQASYNQNDPKDKLQNVSVSFTSNESFNSSNHSENKKIGSTETIKEFNFPSISKMFYQDTIQKLTLKKPQSMQHNAWIKNYQQNISTRQWKLSLFEKMTNKDDRGIYYLSNIKKVILEKQINIFSVQSRQIDFVKCSCGKSSILGRQTINSHLKENNSHKLAINIHTQRQRKYQVKIYDEIGCEMKIQKFDKNWLYKSFQVMFLQADIHFIQVNETKNKQFIIEVLKLKEIDKIFDNSNQKQVESWFTKQWIAIYQTLHNIHKGNQRFCHKCLTMQEHICLFALGLNEFIINNKQTICLKSSIKQFISIMTFCKGLLKDLIEKPKHKKPSTEPKKFKQIVQIQMLLRHLLIRYLQSFDYIDMLEFENINQVNDDLF